MNTAARGTTLGTRFWLVLTLIEVLGAASCTSPPSSGQAGSAPSTHVGLVYYSERDGVANAGALYVRDLHSGKEWRLTGRDESIVGDAGYDWSPTTGRLVYVAAVGDRAEIYTTDITGQSKRRLTNNDMAEISPTWSPDGSRIAFARMEGSWMVARTYIMNADGSDVRPLFSDPAVASGGAAWSPNGRWLALDVPSTSPEQQVASEVLVLEVDTGSEIGRVADGMDHLIWAWSPDSTKLAYAAATYAGGYSDFQLYVLDVSTWKPIRVAAMDVVSAAWSPDSQRLVFTSLGSDASSMYVIRYDGLEPVELPTPLRYNLSGPWSPDGREIVFVAAGAMQESDFDIYTLNVDTRQIDRITDNGFLEVMAKWIRW